MCSLIFAWLLLLCATAKPETFAPLMPITLYQAKQPIEENNNERKPQIDSFETEKKMKRKKILDQIK